MVTSLKGGEGREVMVTSWGRSDVIYIRGNDYSCILLIYWY